MVPSLIVAVLALLFGLNFALIDAGSATFFNTLRSAAHSQNILKPSGASQHDNNISLEPEWDVMRHQGGNSPWIPKEHGVVEAGIEPLPGCRVDQVHMISRHAERFPTTVAGIRMLELYHRIDKANVTLQGDLAFVNTWNFFMSDPGVRFENLVSTGPYAGTLQAFTTGSLLRTRYEHLLDQAFARNQTSFWVSDSKRDIETAKYFGAGFFGIDWQDTSTLHIIPETADREANTLTPGRTCRKYHLNEDAYGHDYGVRKLYEWRHVYLPPIIERLSKQSPGITFTESEVYSMQELCGFETIAKGGSYWCDVFTHEEWEQFEYARDLLHYYRAGPGNPYSGAMGWLWLNATANLLREGPDKAGPLFFSFVHDGDIMPLITALDLFTNISAGLPSTHVPNNRTWRTSDTVPMGGRIILERLICPAPRYYWDNADYGYPNHVYTTPPKEEEFVRVNVNDGIVALPGCESGPGGSCPLGEFLARVEKRGKEVGDFREVCGLEKAEDRKKGIEFLHQ